jgi:ComF family protein
VGLFTVKDGRCYFCQDESYAFTQALTLGKYDRGLREMILRMKHPPGESIGYHLTSQLVKDMEERLKSWPVEAVVPVPLHWSRRLWRGYNQASVIAEVLARRLGKPCRPRWLWRRRQTPPQYTVTTEERRRNLRQAFASRLPSSMKGRNILLADDVMTTGSTADACARALKAAGAGEVYVVVLARATGPSGIDSVSRMT